jgi:hypothetical protein
MGGGIGGEAMSTKGVLFMRAKPDTCRWPLWPNRGETPIGEKRVCGALTRPGSVYCDACRAVAFQRSASVGAWWKQMSKSKSLGA